MEDLLLPVRQLRASWSPLLFITKDTAAGNQCLLAITIAAQASRESVRDNESDSSLLDSSELAQPLTE
jgi:hypothetical protein